MRLNPCSPSPFTSAATPSRRSLGARLRGCARGGVAVEFAMMAPALIALVIACLQVGLLYLAQQGLETASEDTARLVLTGQSQNAGQSAAQFKASACAQLPPYLSCSNLYVDVTTVASFSAANLATPTFTYDTNGNVTNSFNYSTGSKNSIVVLRLMYLLPVVDIPFGLRLSNQGAGKRLIMATAVFKNEIYA